MAGPLTGLRVLDLTRVLAGPWCTQIFADLGAEVIKVERPGMGDDTRQWGPPWLKDKNGIETDLAAYYLSANRGKHSIAIDIASPEGQALVRELAAKSDIFIENFKTGSLAQKSLGYEDIKTVRDDIIYCSITGFGQTGPRANEPGYDYLAQAMGGLMSVTGQPDGEPGAGPQRVGLAVGDLTTGMNAAIAILAAVVHRQNTGEGQHIDMSLLDVQVSWLANQALNYFVSGKTPQRSGVWHPNLAPYQPFPTKDGDIILAVGNDRQFARLCAEIGREDLATDERFATNPARVANRAALAKALAAEIVKDTVAGWTARLGRISVSCCCVNTIPEALEDPQTRHRGLKIEIDHPELGAVPGVANPIKYSKTRPVYAKAPPRLGEDTAAVLRHVLDKDDTAIARLREAKVVEGRDAPRDQPKPLGKPTVR